MRERFSEGFVLAAHNIVRVMGGLLFLGLTGIGFFTSQYILPGMDELPVNKMDGIGWHLSALVLLAVVLWGIRWIEKNCGEIGKRRLEWCLAVVMILWIGVWGFWWIGSLERVPEGDQAYIYAAASYFLEGDYSFLQERGYCQLYPQQLGLIALMEGLFAVVGAYQYSAFQVLCVLMAMGSGVMGLLLLKEFKAGFTAGVLYCLLMMGCIPMICYTSWVYGDLPGVFFMLLVAWFLLRYGRLGKWYDLLGGIIFGVAAVLVRKNSLIFLIACALTALVYSVLRRNLRLLIMTISITLAAILCGNMIHTIYESRSGYEIGDGLPASSWVAMGMQENRGVCGWYNNMPKEVAEELDYDFEQMKNRMNELMESRLREFAQNPSYAVRFYGKKIISQWNHPLYQSVYFSEKYEGTDMPAKGSMLDGLYHVPEDYFKAFEFADQWQLVIYFGTFCYFAVFLRKRKEPLLLLLPATILGGFFFSVIWEAKARYIFPYYVLMYPMAALGYEAVCRGICNKFKKEREVKA